MIRTTIFILVGIILYALTVPILNTIHNHLKEKAIERWKNMDTVIYGNSVMQGAVTIYDEIYA